MTKKDEYNVILKRLFETVVPGIPGLSGWVVSRGEYNRVRHMCRVYGTDRLAMCLDSLERILAKPGSLEFNKMGHLLNYLQGMARRSLLLDINVPNTIVEDLDDVFKPL